MKKWLFVVAKVLVLALVLWYVHKTLADGISELNKSKLSLDWTWLGVSGLLYLLALAPAARFWQRVMHAMGQDAPLLQTVRAYFIGHLGKYVPGKAMVVVMRTGMMHGSGVEAGAGVVSVFFETLTMMAVGSLMAAVILAIGYPDQWKLALIALGLTVVSGAPTIPPIFKLMVRLTAVGKKYPNAADKVSRVGYRVLLGGWLGMGVSWILQGWSLWAALQAMGATLDPLKDLPLCIAVVAMAVVAGFVSMIPGGFFVRESVLIRLLVPHVGEGAAVASSVVLRVVWTVAELGISAILYFAGGRAEAAPQGQIDS